VSVVIPADLLSCRNKILETSEGPAEKARAKYIGDGATAFDGINGAIVGLKCATLRLHLGKRQELLMLLTDSAPDGYDTMVGIAKYS